MTTLPVPPDPRNYQQTRDALRAIVASLKTLFTMRQTNGAVTTLTGAGAPTFSAPNGTLYVDTTNHRLYARSGGAWKYAALT